MKNILLNINCTPWLSYVLRNYIGITAFTVVLMVFVNGTVALAEAAPNHWTGLQAPGVERGVLSISIDYLCRDLIDNVIVEGTTQLHYCADEDAYTIGEDCGLAVWLIPPSSEEHGISLYLRAQESDPPSDYLLFNSISLVAQRQGPPLTNARGGVDNVYLTDGSFITVSASAILGETHSHAFCQLAFDIDGPS